MCVGVVGEGGTALVFPSCFVAPDMGTGAAGGVGCVVVVVCVCVCVGWVGGTLLGVPTLFCYALWVFL